MRRPQYLARGEDQRLDRDEDLAAALAALGRGLKSGPRSEVAALCHRFLRRLDAASIPPDDRTEIAALVELLEDRVKYGLNDRLRKLLLPLVAAVECQMEQCE